MTQTIQGGIKDVIQKLKVKNLIISKQIEKTDECRDILNISKERKTKVAVIEKGTKIKIDKSIYFDILWLWGLFSKLRSNINLKLTLSLD